MLQYNDFNSITIEELRKRAICIDTEYHTDGSGAIVRVYCVCASDGFGHSFKHWFYSGDNCPSLLGEIAESFGIAEPIFIAHAYDLAERQALLHLGVNPYQFDWLCTFHIARVCQNSFSFQKGSLSLAALCKKHLGVEIDTSHKEKMRGLCIEDSTEGHEHDIMAYCLSDTVYLLPLAEQLIEIYTQMLNRAKVVHGRFMFKSALGLLLWQTRLYSIFGRVADRGFPVNRDRVERMKRGAEVMRDRLFSEFSRRWPGTYTKAKPVKSPLEEALGADYIQRLKEGEEEAWRDAEDDLKTFFDGDKRGLSKARKALATVELFLAPAREKITRKQKIKENLWHGHTAQIQEFLETFLQESGALDRYPRTATGKLKTDTETLSEWFRGGEGFGSELYRLSRETSLLKGCSEEWVKTLRGSRLLYRSLHPYASATGRCQGKPSEGFVPAWSHFLYGVLEPPEGKWLVELDFSSEETGIQAVICKDRAYVQAYDEKDLYLWIGTQMGAIPTEDYNTLTTKELKEKYHDIRTKLKTFVLAWSYGCGVQKLAAKAGIPVEKAQRVREALNCKIFKASTQWKRALLDSVHHSAERASRERWSKKASFLATPDGWICRTAVRKDETPKGDVSILNWPFQSFGSYILRRLAETLAPLEGVEPIATMHDAVFFLVKEGDTESIERVREIMVETANRCLGLGDRRFIRVGEPEIIRHGEIWCPEADNVTKFLSLMDAGSPDMDEGQITDEDENENEIEGENENETLSWFEFPSFDEFEEEEFNLSNVDLSVLDDIFDTSEQQPCNLKKDEWGVEILEELDSKMFEL